MYYHEKIGNLDQYLEDIEKRLNEQEEEAIYQNWKNYADGKTEFNKIQDVTRTAKPSEIEWPDVVINEALEDETLMLYSVYKGCSKQLENGGHRLLTVRANYGVGILPNAIGNVEFFKMEDAQNTLPNVRAYKGGGAEAMEELISKDLPDVYEYIGKKVFSIGKKFMEIKAKYPKIGKAILFDSPDCQGPMDVAELLWGSDIFVDLYEEPELVHEVLGKINEFYKKFNDEWFRIVPNDTGYHVVYGTLNKGKILLRDDSAMNLSPAFFREFIQPYDQDLLNYYGGGCVHFCGTGDHFVPIFKEMDKVYAINMSQPHLNKMDAILSETVDHDINLITNIKDTVPVECYPKHKMYRISNC